MKKMTKTLLILLSLSLLACAGPSSKQSSKEEAARTPASTKSAPTAWGKSVNPETEEFLDEVENAPVGRYPGKPIP